MSSTVASATSLTTSTLRVRVRTVPAPVLRPSDWTQAATFRRRVPESGTSVKITAVASETATAKARTVVSTVTAADAGSVNGAQSINPRSSP